MMKAAWIKTPSYQTGSVLVSIGMTMIVGILIIVLIGVLSHNIPAVIQMIATLPIWVVMAYVFVLVVANLIGLFIIERARDSPLRVRTAAKNLSSKLVPMYHSNSRTAIEYELLLLFMSSGAEYTDAVASVSAVEEKIKASGGSVSDVERVTQEVIEAEWEKLNER